MLNRSNNHISLILIIIILVVIGGCHGGQTTTRSERITKDLHDDDDDDVVENGRGFSSAMGVTMHVFLLTGQETALAAYSSARRAMAACGFVVTG